MKVFRYKNGFFELDGNCLIAGIVNVTPDSFSDGGLFFDADSAVKHALKLVGDGADIIDIGAMSTRPGSEPVSVREEIRRLEPVLKELNKTKIIISVDTVNPETAEFAISCGAHIINDVSGVFNDAMAAVVKRHSAGWIMTHTGNVPAGTVVEYRDGVINSINSFFDDFLEKCTTYGVDKECICIDPGFGFAKSTDDNIALLKNLEETIRDGVVCMTALSRKRFVGEITGAEIAADRLAGTLTADIIAVMKGSDILRVHDVKETVQSVAIYNSIK